MNSAVLEERIKYVLKNNVMLRAPNYEVTTHANSDGTVDMNMTTTMEDVYMNEEMATLIAKAVAEGVTEYLSGSYTDYLKDNIDVKVPNASTGPDTLTGYLE